MSSNPDGYFGARSSRPVRGAHSPGLLSLCLVSLESGIEVEVHSEGPGLISTSTQDEIKDTHFHRSHKTSCRFPSKKEKHSLVVVSKIILFFANELSKFVSYLQGKLALGPLAKGGTG